METRSSRILRMLKLSKNANIKEANPVGRPYQHPVGRQEIITESSNIKILSNVIIQEGNATQISDISSTSADLVNDHQLNSNNTDLNYDSFSEDKSSGSEYFPSNDEESSIPKNDDTTNGIKKKEQNRLKPNELSEKEVLQDYTTEFVTANAPCSSTSDEVPLVPENNLQVKIFASIKHDGGKRIRNKGHFCYFCHKTILNFAQHLQVMHNNETEVAKLLVMPKNSKTRRDGFGSLMRAGDFYQNIEVLSTSKGELILVRRPTEQEAKINTYKDYGPCPHCLGFMLKKHLWHHIKTSCITKRNKLLDLEIVKNNRLVIAESNAILNNTFGAEFSNDFVINISSKLRDDDVGEYCKKDNLILKFGAMQFEKYGTTQCELIRQSMRQLSRFTLQLREIDNCGSRSLSDYLLPEKFDMVVQATKLLCVSHKSNVRRPEFEVPSLALKIGYALKKCAAIKRGSCLKAGNLKGNETLLSFLTLMDLEWSIRISSNALSTLMNRKINATQLLPITNDLIKLSKFIDDNMRASRDMLIKCTTTQNWTHLASLCLSKVILFNKRRSGESSRMTIENYVTRPNWNEQCTDELKKSLTPFEKTLANQLAVIDIIGKRGRRVPVLLTTEIQMSIEILLKTRNAVNISKSNLYLFARTGDSVEYMRGHDCLKKCCLAAELEHPENISSTKLRKYIATVCQVFNMSENEYDWLARHLGHDIRVHRDFYRLHESAVELTKVSRLLIAVDKGEVNKFAGKKLQDINLDDFTNLEEEGMSEDEDVEVEVEQENENLNVEIETTYGTPVMEKRKTQSSAARKAHSSAAGKTQNKKSSVIKRPWTLKEKEAVLTYFKRDIQNARVPGKAKCTECIEKNSTVLSNRSWTDVKFCIKNQIDKIKKLKA